MLRFGRTGAGLYRYIPINLRPPMEYRYGRQKQQVPADVVLTKWCDTVIARSHAFYPKIRAIADHQERNELTSVSIRGREGTGKTTVAKLIAHALHEELEKKARATDEVSDYMRRHRQALKRGYLVRILTADDLKNFSAILEGLPDLNRILIFDDTSFLGASSSAVVTKIKRDLTTVRHARSGDLKTVLILNFHYSKSLDPYLRDTHYIIQTSISPQEMKAVEELYGNDKASWKLLKAYQVFARNLAGARGQTTIGLGARGYDSGRTVTYRYSDPFRLATFWDGESLRLMVFPSAGEQGASDPLGVQECGLCGAGGPKASKLKAADVLDWMGRQWSNPARVGAILRDAYVRRYGRDPWCRGNNQGLEMIHRLEANGLIRFDDLLTSYYTGKQGGDKVIETLEKTAGTRIPNTKREAFALAFKCDGLRPPGAAELDAVQAEAEAEAEAEALV